MTEKVADRKCPECETVMGPIKIIDRNAVSGGHIDGQLSYAAASAQRDMFFGIINAKGTVNALACPGCGRILLYANPGGKP